MTRVHSKNTVIIIDGNDISVHCNTSEFSRTVDSHDVTTYGASNHVYDGGLGDGTASIGGFYDNTVSTGPRAVLEPIIEGKTVVPYVRRVEGTGTGKPQDAVNVLVTSYVESSPVADFVTWTAELQLSGDVVPTTQS
jgi:hypothetical protein